MSKPREMTFWQGAEAGPGALFLPKCPACGQRRFVRHGLLAEAMAFAEEAFGITRAELMEGRRLASHVEARAFVVWALRTLGKRHSYKAIARMLGGYDHTTMIYLHQKAIAQRLRGGDFARACAAFIIRIDPTTEQDHADASH